MVWIVLINYQLQSMAHLDTAEISLLEFIENTSNNVIHKTYKSSLLSSVFIYICGLRLVTLRMGLVR